MPELPEVETVARGLRQTVLGRRIVSATLGKTDFIDDPVALEQQLPGRRIEAVERYGKFMLLRLSAPNGTNRKNSLPVNNADIEASLLVHLGMTGKIGACAAEQPWEKHTHVCFVLDDGRELRYIDPRRFGRMAYLAGESLTTELKRFGLEPLEMSAAEFAESIRMRRARIKALLLDQRVLRGVGNIYADESLWRARIHPAQLGDKLTKEQAKELHAALQAILHKAIALRGSSISDFVDITGTRGEYQHHHQVYGREGKACPRCKSIIRRVIVAGRSSHFCPKCQPGPRGYSIRTKPQRKKIARTIRQKAGVARNSKKKLRSRQNR